VGIFVHARSHFVDDRKWKLQLYKLVTATADKLKIIQDRFNHRVRKRLGFKKRRTSCFTSLQNIIRIISARKATTQELKAYQR